MKLLRFHTEGGIRPGILDSAGALRDLSDHVADIDGATLSPDALDRLRGLDASRLPRVEGNPRLAPCVGGVGKVMCIGLNYSDHAAEAGMAVPEHPILFLKATSALAGAGDPIVLPRGSSRTDWEVELAVVIGRPAKYVSHEQALAHVAGYCVMNDLSERDFQLNLTGQWTKGKSCDGFGPLGPWLATADEIPDPQALGLRLWVNGTLRQQGSSATMIFPVAQVISHLSQLMTLQPGDVIATGTPPGVGMGLSPPQFLRSGDRVEAEIDGLGRQVQIVQADI